MIEFEQNFQSRVCVRVFVFVFRNDGKPFFLTEKNVHSLLINIYFSHFKG